MPLSLAQALRVSSATSIAFVGAGGKTTAMFQLARELRGPVIVTATSHLGRWQTGLADKHWVAQTADALKELEQELSGILLITGPLDGQRTQAIDHEVLHWLRQFCADRAIPLLIEADGSREKPLKAWADHEPPVPGFVDMVVHVVGLEGLGKALANENVHRAEIFSNLSGLGMGEEITPAALVRVLTHREGGRKNIPANARNTILLNQADTTERQSMAAGLVQSLTAFYDAVLIASLKQKQIFAVHEPVGGVVLAAGEATRYGQPKQLLDWKGSPFVRAVAVTALQAGLSPVVVVSGAHAEAVENAVSDLPLLTIRNKQWKSGQASSIRAGVQSLIDARPGNAGGAVFLLADQPQLTESILRALMEKHAEALYPVVAPMVMDQRANPVLFDRVTFPDLLALEGDVGGRAIFHKHRVEYLPWHDDRLLLDVDTPEMYQRLLSDDSL